MMSEPFGPEGEQTGRAFDGVDLAGQTLLDRSFTDCTFENGRFAGGTWRQCRLTDCTFTRCDLSVAKWGHSTLLRVRFDGCKLIGIDWTAVQQRFLRLEFVDCLLDQSSFAAMNVSGTRFIRCSAVDVDFRDTNLASAVLDGTNLDRSEFLHTNLAGADLSGASNYAIDPTTNSVRKMIVSLPEAVGLLTGFGLTFR
jgi:uncharacterized protein YjbI with pentapeptide repeats